MGFHPLFRYFKPAKLIVLMSLLHSKSLPAGHVLTVLSTTGCGDYTWL